LYEASHISGMMIAGTVSVSNQMTAFAL